MDYTKWPPPQPSKLNQPPLIDPYTSHHSFYPQNPDPTQTLSHSSLKPHCLCSSTLAHGPPGVNSYDGLAARPYDLHQTVDTASVGYYLDPNSLNWAAGVTVPVNGTEQLPVSNARPTLWTNPTVRPHGNDTWKKHPKKTKIVQSAYCEICKIDCNSKDVLDQHKLGKKHQKNLEKLLEAAAPSSSASMGSTHPVIGPQENPNRGKTVEGQKSRKKAAEPVEDIETKRRKIVEGGAAAEAVRACTICNVVCNGETVFSFHLAGQKHAAMVKKLATGTSVATAT